MNKKQLLFFGYAILTILAIIFLFLAIFTNDNQTYLMIGLISVIFASMLNLLRDSGKKPKSKTGKEGFSSQG